MDKRIIKYRFSALFPKSLREAFLDAFLKATQMWEKSGVVEFMWTADRPDFYITYEMIGKEYGDISKQLTTPRMSYRNHMHQEVDDSALIVNCIYKWKTRFYHVFRQEFDPIIIAHNLGHIMGLCIKKHVGNLHSVMFENPISPPGEKDFHILKLALTKKK
jgi:hypothetical protein